MFGTLRISNCRLEDRDRELYRGQFCGACHAMHEFSGRSSSLLTNYDQTVLALMLGGLERSERIERRPCTAMPLRRVSVVPLSVRSRRYLAALNLVLAEAKLRDDRDDETLVRRWLARGGLLWLDRRARRGARALADLGFSLDAVQDLPARQSRVEATADPTLALLAAPSAELTAQVFAGAAAVTGRPELTGLLRRFGHALGAFVYAEDARRDRQADRMRGRFNAIDASFGLVAGATETHAFQHEQLAILRSVLPQLGLGGQGVLLGHLLDTLDTEMAKAARSKEAGDCDCISCDCCSLDCCSSGGGACDLSCGGGNGSCCNACNAPCDCCWWEPGGRRKKRVRQQAPTDAADDGQMPPLQ